MAEKSPIVKSSRRHAQEFDWGRIDWSVNADLVDSEHLTMGRVELASGASNQRHYHPNCDEALFLVAGSISHLVDEEWYDLEAGDTVLVPTGTWHQARNTSDETAIMIIAYDTGYRQVVFDESA